MSEIDTRACIATLTHGDLIVQWPRHLTPADYEDIEAYVILLLRHMKRTAQMCSYVALPANPPEEEGT